MPIELKQSDLLKIGTPQLINKSTAIQKGLAALNLVKIVRNWGRLVDE
jgi:hypothetical protein